MALTSVTSVLGGVGGQCHAQTASPMGKSLGTHFEGCWVGSGASLNGYGEEKIFPPIQFEHQAVQTVATCHANYTIPAVRNSFE